TAAQQERPRTDGDVQVEDPPPVVVVGDVAPSVGPTTGASSAAMPNIVCAVPRRSGGNASRRTPWLDRLSPPPAGPWRTQNAISAIRLVAIPHSIDATVKTAMDRRK